MKNLLLYFSMILSLLLISCNSGLKTRLAELETENSQLRQELEKYQNSPTKLLAHIKDCFGKKAYTRIEELYQQMLTYNAGTPECDIAKQYVDKVNTIIEQEKEAERIKADKEKAERLAAVGKLKKKYDEIGKRTWYEQPYFTHYIDVNKVSLYIGDNDIKTWLRFKASYHADDWIFFKNVYLYYDGTTYEIPFDEYKDKETDVDGGISEWIDISVQNEFLQHLKASVEAKDVKIRFSGKYTKDRTLSNTERQGIKLVLMAYDVLRTERENNK